MRFQDLPRVTSQREERIQQLLTDSDRAKESLQKQMDIVGEKSPSIYLRMQREWCTANVIYQQLLIALASEKGETYSRSNLLQAKADLCWVDDANKEFRDLRELECQT